jgi:ketosteroid isomerase-like protein
MDLDSVLGFALSVLRVVADFRYEDAVRSVTASGFVEEHNVRGTLPDGSDLNLAVCVVADVHDGRVSDLREYFDGVAAAGLASALS